eukprot:SAG11_NODE_5797_length_1461_cov_2.171806_1_plen_52_part_10
MVFDSQRQAAVEKLVLGLESQDTIREIPPPVFPGRFDRVDRTMIYGKQAPYP